MKNLELSKEFGYNGQVKQNSWNPLEITLNSDTDLEGDIVFEAANPIGSNRISSVHHVKKGASLNAVPFREAYLQFSQAVAIMSYSRSCYIKRFSIVVIVTSLWTSIRKIHPMKKRNYKKE